MSRLSSDTLFHFTNYQSLLGILRNGFFPRLSIENYSTSEMSFIVAIPMVCFCDIPLSSINDHSYEYGKYAIGVKKNWAISNGFSPVCYYHNNAEIYKRAKEVQYFLIEIWGNPFSNIFLSKEKIEKSLGNQYNVLFHMKQVEGKSTKNGKLKKFYDEREWRYIPTVNHVPGGVYFINQCYFSEQKLNEENSKLENQSMKITIEDINYIIIEKENNRVDLIMQLKEIFSNVDEYISSQKILIMTQEQINNDF